jgi:thiosulfate reductase cytochrome b subunit
MNQPHPLSNAVLAAAHAMPVSARRPTHPLWLRISHWLNVVAVVLLVTSGWRIYNAAPFFAFSIPADITLGGWLGGAIQWHFAAMWLLAINGLIYLVRNTVSGRWRDRFWPIRPAEVLHDLVEALRGRLAHADTHATTRCKSSPTSPR